MSWGSAGQVVGKGARRWRRRARGHWGSLDTDRCSDMLEQPENAETNRVFVPSASWWMRPRRLRTRVQRTHLVGPSGIRTASDQLARGPRETLRRPSRPLARRLPNARLDESKARNFAVSRAAPSVPSPRSSRLERQLLCDNPLIGAGSGGGTSLAHRITQMVPRTGMEPLNREGARR